MYACITIGRDLEAQADLYVCVHTYITCMHAYLHIQRRSHTRTHIHRHNTYSQFSAYSDCLLPSIAIRTFLAAEDAMILSLINSGMKTEMFVTG